MMRRFLKETPNAAARSLSVGRHQVHDSWDQLQAFLHSTLGEAHAALFAEPFRSGNITSWMAATDAEPVAFARLPADQQEALLARLGVLLDELAAFALQQKASKSEESQHWGELLEAVQLQPSGVPLTDRLFSASGQPVLVQWGCRDDATTVTGTLLQERRAARPAAPVVAQAAAVAAAPVTAAPAQVVHVAEEQRASFLPALLWALFVLTMAVIFWLLLAACMLNLPPAFRIFGECRDTSAIGVEGQRNADLTDRLRDLRGNLDRAAQCRIAGDPAQGWAPPPLPQQDSDFDRARERAGGEIGDITLTLLWNGHSDLDLMVSCPGGEVVAGSGNGGQMVCGGAIDVDANLCTAREAGPGSVCTAYREPPISNPVENGFFNEAGAQRGTFLVHVRHFAAGEDAPSAPIPFVLEMRRGDDRQRFDGTAQPGQMLNITSFQID